MSLSSWCIASHIISQLWLTSHPRGTAVLLDTEALGTGSSREIYDEDAEGETETRNPWITNQCSGHWAIQLESYCWEGVEFIQLVYSIIIYLSFLNGDWLCIWEVQRFYWTQKLLLPVEKFTGRMPKVRLELATPGLQTQCSSHWAIQLKSYCWEGVEFIQLVYCIIIYLSFLNCDWLLIREVQQSYWTQKLMVLVAVEKFTVRMPKVRLELATPGLQTQCSSHWAIQLKKLLLGRSWVYPVGVLHHYIFIISQLSLTSHPRSTAVLLDRGTPGTGSSREIYSEDAEGETRTRNPWITNPVL